METADEAADEAAAYAVEAADEVADGAADEAAAYAVETAADEAAADAVEPAHVAPEDADEVVSVCDSVPLQQQRCERWWTAVVRVNQRMSMRNLGLEFL